MTTRSSEGVGRLLLAPMEGVMDATLRDLITRNGGFDLCVTEFLRVVDELLPPRVFFRLCPELRTGSRTPAGTPVRLQLLGNNPEAMAANAERAVALGSPGVDLNFGCPARTVNKSRGGAILLTEPETLYRVVSAVRRVVPATQPVTAKMRLGFEDRDLLLDNARALVDAGAAELVVHARTKVDGYKPPAYWNEIARVAEVADAHGVPVVANGEVWSRADYDRCRAESGVADVMLGRGALALPNLAAVIARGESPWDWPRTLAAVIELGEIDIAAGRERYMPSRIKQWLKYLERAFPEARDCFERVKRVRTAAEMQEKLCDGVPQALCTA